MPEAAEPALVTFLLDRSSSMGAIRDATIEAFNGYLGTLKEGNSDGIEFTFLQFDSVSLDKLYVAAPVKTVPDLTRQTFEPRGGTPLIDAAVKTINATAKALAERPGSTKVVVCIQTDGEENQSTEYTWQDLNALIKAKTAEGWQFNFMGAGIDAYAQGAKMGISAGQTMSYNSADLQATKSAFRASAQNTRGFASGAMQSTAYLSTQRMASGEAAVLRRPSPAARPAATAPVAPVRARHKAVDDITL